MIKDYVAFDLETTGLDIENDYVIEIGALKVINGKVCDRFIEFVKPPILISSRITGITGITNEMVEHARNTEEIFRDFINFCDGYTLVGHNILFDYKFVKKYAMTYGFSFEKTGIDTLRIARKVHKEMESKSLGNLCAHYSIVNQSAHRAYHDALATAKLYHILAHDFESTYPELFQPERLQYKYKKVQPCTTKQIEYLKMLCAYHNLPMQEHIEKLTRSEASKEIDGILATYGMMKAIVKEGE